MALALSLVFGCAASSSTEPTASGRGLGGIHRISVGDELVLHFPVSKTGAAKWRLTSFDSLMLRVTQRPRLEARQWVLRFVARTPGETDVVVTRTATNPDGSGSIGERRRFRVRISS